MVLVYKDIGKTCSDLLSKDFDTGKNKLEVKTKTSNGVEFTPKATLSGNNMSGSLVAKYAFAGGISTEATVNTKGVLETNLKAVDAVMKGLTLEFDCATAEPGKSALLSSGKATAEFKQDAFNCKASYDYFTSNAAASVAAGRGSVTFGGSVDYSAAKSAMTKYSAALQFDQPDFTLMTKLSESMSAGGQEYTGSYYHKVSSSMQVGTELNKKHDKDIALAFGCTYKLDKDTNVKGKVDADGKLAASYKQKISSLTTLTLAAAVDTLNLADSANHKFGMSLTITP